MPRFRSVDNMPGHTIVAKFTAPHPDKKGHPSSLFQKCFHGVEGKDKHEAKANLATDLKKYWGATKIHNMVHKSELYDGKTYKTPYEESFTQRVKNMLDEGFEEGPRHTVEATYTKKSGNRSKRVTDTFHTHAPTKKDALNKVGLHLHKQGHTDIQLTHQSIRVKAKPVTDGSNVVSLAAFRMRPRLQP